mmetsp:Transcript_18583/g.25573  ORF Transcript_18583/g.25573 Transcript_18583/m.25573 type:complete len:260 (-) Transcript_18583:162-941(-)
MPSPLSSNKLSVAIAQGQWDAARTILREDEKLAAHRAPAPSFFGDGKTSDIFPIHQAVMSRAPADFLEELIRAHPRGVGKEESAYRRTPLHIACRNLSSGEVIFTLLHHDKEAAAHQDNMGRIPLHYALSNGGTVEMVRALVEASPNTVTATDRAGWTPLHVACNQHCTLDIVEYLLKQDPEGVILRTNCGSDPVGLVTKADSPDKEKILEILKAEENKQSKKTEYVRIRNAEKKMSEKDKNAATVRKVSNRASIRKVD